MEEVKNACRASVDGASQAVGLDDPEAGTPTPGDSVEVTDLAGQLAAVTQQRDKLAEEKSALSDRLLRFQAEFDNFRKRQDREKGELLEYSGLSAVREILPIADDFERALKMDCPDKEYSRGMEMVYQRLADALKKLGLEVISTVGQKFDPNLHHAVSKEPTAELEEDVILEEYQKGYHFKGRLLRPAMVKVAVRP